MSEKDSIRSKEPLTLIDSSFSWAKRLVNERTYQQTLNRANISVYVEEHTARGAFYATVTGMISVLIGILIIPTLVGILVEQFDISSVETSVSIDIPQQLAPIVAVIIGFVSSNIVPILSILGILLVFVVVWLTIFGVYIFYPMYIVSERERKIDEYIQDSLVYLYSMTDGGRSVEDAFARLKDREESYGEFAKEASRITSRVQTQVDIITALRRQANATPSSKLRQLLNDLASSMEQGTDVSAFFDSQIQRFRDEQLESMKQKNSFMELIIRVFTILLISSSFLIILGIVSSILGSAFGGLLTAAPFIPLVVGFLFGGLFYILFGRLVPDAGQPTFTKPPQYRGATPSEKVKGWTLANRIESNLISRSTFVDNPYLILLFTVPVTGVYFALVNPLTAQLIDSPLTVGFVYLYIPLLILALPYSILYEIKAYGLRSVRDELPELLRQVEQANRQGVRVPDAILGVTEDVDTKLSNKLYNEIKMSKQVSPKLLRHALQNVAKEFEEPQVRRGMQLLSDTYEETGDATSVLAKINSYLEQMREVRRERKRIGTTFGVFGIAVSIITIVVLLIVQFQVLSIFGDISTGGGGLGLGTVPTAKAGAVILYTSFNTMIVSGVLVGQLRTGKLSASVKYIILLTGLSLVIFVIAPFIL